MSDRPSMRPSFTLDLPFVDEEPIVEIAPEAAEAFELLTRRTLKPPPLPTNIEVIEAFVVTTPKGDELVPLDYDDEVTKVYAPGELERLLTLDSRPTLPCPPSAPVRSQVIEITVMDCSVPLRTTPPNGIAAVKIEAA